MQNPLLGRAAITTCEHQGGAVYRAVAAADVDALAPDTSDGAIGDRPSLTGAAAAGYVDDGSSVHGRASLHIDAKPRHARELAVVGGPLLVLPRITGLHLERCPGNRVAVVLDVDTLVRTAAGNLMRRCTGTQ